MEKLKIQKDIESLNNEMEELQQSYNHNKKLEAQLLSEIDRLTDELDYVKHNLDRNREKTKYIQEEIDYTQSQINRLQERLKYITEE